MLRLTHLSSAPFAALLAATAPSAAAFAQQLPDPGDPTALPVRVEVLGPADCPTAREFVRRLNAHLPVRAARADEPAHVLVVTVEARGSGVAGRLDSPSTSSLEGHDLEARTCNAVLDSLAFSAALALEGRALPREPQDPEAAESRKPGSAQVPSEGREPSDPVAAASPEDAPTSEPDNMKTTRPTTGTKSSVEPGRGQGHPIEWSSSLGIRGWAVALPPLMGPELQLVGGDRRFQARLRLAYLGEVADSSEQLSLRTAALGFDLCALAISGRSGSLGMCATSDVAAAWGRGQGLTQETTRMLGFAASGARIRGTWQFKAPWSLEADGGLEGVWWAPRWEASDPPRILEAARRWKTSVGLALNLSF